MGAQGVLEIEQAGRRPALAAPQPDEVLGVEVAVTKDAGAGLAARADRGEDGVPLGPRLAVEPERGRQLTRKPVEEKFAGCLCNAKASYVRSG